MSRPRLLVTGAGGFCGEHACRYFNAEGWEVTAVVRRHPQPGEAEWLAEAGEVAVCDLTSRADTEALVARVKPDYVLHLAGMNAVGPSWRDPSAVMENNVMGTIHLLEAIRRLEGGLPQARAAGTAGGTEAGDLTGKGDDSRAGDRTRMGDGNRAGDRTRLGDGNQAGDGTQVSAGNRGAEGDRSAAGTSRIGPRDADGGSVRVVVAGSMLRFPLPAAGELPAPPHPYSLSKTMQVLAAQSWAALYAMDVIVAEPANLIGPGRSTGICALIAGHAAAVERAAERGEPLPAPFRLSSRTERRDLLDVRDAIRAYDLLLTRGERGRVYPVASGVMRTLGEVADTFDRLARSPLRWEVGDSHAPSPEPADITAIQALGWSPRFALEQSLSDAMESVRRAMGR
jgi:nucleoside-diphosphate-sugar epimerase